LQVEREKRESLGRELEKKKSLSERELDGGKKRKLERELE